MTPYYVCFLVTYPSNLDFGHRLTREETSVAAGGNDEMWRVDATSCWDDFSLFWMLTGGSRQSTAGTLAIGGVTSHTSFMIGIIA